MLNLARLFLVFLTSLFLGLALNSTWPLSLQGLLFIFSSVAVLLLLSNKKLLLPFSLVIFGFTLSFFRVQIFNANVSIANPGLSKYTGYIISELEIKGKSQVFTFQAQKGHKFEVRTNQFPRYQFSDYLKIEGELKSKNTKADAAKNISGSLNYPQSIKTIKNKKLPADIRFRKGLIELKNQFQSKVVLLLPNTNAGLINGVIFGTRSALDNTLRDLLVASGTIHIIALSGFNITIIIDFFRRLTLNFSPLLMFIFTTVGIVAFILATGLSASIIRAAIMGWVWLLAKQVGRQDDPLIAIIFSATIMAFLNPYIIFYDIGFQLSFAAFIGLIYLAPLIAPKLNFLGSELSDLLAGSVGATIATIPILSYHFEGFSIIAPISNLFILPVIPPLMLSGFLLGLSAIVLPTLADLFALTSWLLSEYLIKTVGFFGSLSFSSVDFKIKSPMIVFFFYLVVIEIILLKKRSILGRKEI